MDTRPLLRSLWTWLAAAVLVTVVTVAISAATDTAGEGNDSGLAEVMNVIGFVTMLAVPPLLVAAVVQTVVRRRRVSA